MDEKLSNIEYINWIKSLKTKIREAQNKVTFSINSQLLELYWECRSRARIASKQYKLGQ